MIYTWQESKNRKLKYNYHPSNDYSPNTHIYGAVSSVIHLLKDKKDLVIAEIGVFRGESTLTMFEYLDIKKAYLIDPFDMNIANVYNPTDGTNRHLHSNLFNETKSKLSKYEDRIVWLCDVSEKVYNKIPDNELDFIFIDGAHTYEAVYKDLVYYYQKVKMNGIISGDDFSNKFEGFGVIDAVNDVLSSIGYTEIDVYKHSFKPIDYYSSFAITKTIEALI